ncbi:hypothetical protein SAMN06272771_0041 [Streptomyces sp. Ag82_O1-12]|nr:hypothetical protein SAMN06272771_0041 [Streptomyces sp. Ag82_O1-12]
MSERQKGAPRPDEAPSTGVGRSRHHLVTDATGIPLAVTLTGGNCVERAFAHLHWFRRLRIRWEIRDDIHEALLTLGCSIICWGRLKNHHA